MKVVNIHQAKTQLSKLVEEVSAGEEVVIARNNKPVVELKPCSARPRLTPGLWKESNVHLPDNYDEPDTDIIALFENG